MDQSILIPLIGHNREYIVRQQVGQTSGFILLVHIIRVYRYEKLLSGILLSGLLWGVYIYNELSVNKSG